MIKSRKLIWANKLVISKNKSYCICNSFYFLYFKKKGGREGDPFVIYSLEE